MQRGEAVILLNVHQLPRSGQDLLCGPATRTNKTQLASVQNSPHGSWLRLTTVICAIAVPVLLKVASNKKQYSVIECDSFHANY